MSSCPSPRPASHRAPAGRPTSAGTSQSATDPTPVRRTGSHRAVLDPGTPRRRARTGVRRSVASVVAVGTSAAMLTAMVVAQPAAQADPAPQAMSVAEQLSLTAASTVVADQQVGSRLADQVANRSERLSAEVAAATAQAAADQAVLDAQAEAARVAAEAARIEAEARAAAEAAAAAAAAAATPASFHDYALQQLGGDGGQFGCLQNLWGKESGWNPNAQNPTSTAYGIAQFLNSTWKMTGIAKTSDGYRQIDAGLIYIDKVYGSPCAAWSHSQAKNWY